MAAELHQSTVTIKNSFQYKDNCFLLPEVDKQHIWIKMKPSILREEITQIWNKIFYQNFFVVVFVRESKRISFEVFKWQDMEDYTSIFQKDELFSVFTVQDVCNSQWTKFILDIVKIDTCQTESTLTKMKDKIIKIVILAHKTLNWLWELDSHLSYNSVICSCLLSKHFLLAGMDNKAYLSFLHWLFNILEETHLLCS